MMEDAPVLVFGATGQQGGAVASALRIQGRAVRAFVRDPASEGARSLKALGCTLAKGDLADLGSIEAALDGIYGVFSVQPSSGQVVYGITDADEIAFGTKIADAAQRAGVRHFVYSSVAVSGSGPTGMGHFDSKLAIERHLASLAMPTTIVRPSTFMELLMLPGLGLEQGCLTFFTRPEQPTQFVAIADIGRVVAAVFARPEIFAGQAFEIASDMVAGRDIAVMLSDAAARRINYRRFPDAVLAENPFLAGLAKLFDTGRMASNADLPSLRRLVPDLYRFDGWLAGPGKPLLMTALRTAASDVALR